MPFVYKSIKTTQQESRMGIVIYVDNKTMNDDFMDILSCYNIKITSAEFMRKEVYHSVIFFNRITCDLFASWICDLQNKRRHEYINEMFTYFTENFIIIEDLVASGAKISEFAIKQRRYNIIRDYYNSNIKKFPKSNSIINRNSHH